MILFSEDEEKEYNQKSIEIVEIKDDIFFISGIEIYVIKIEKICE